MSEASEIVFDSAGVAVEVYGIQGTSLSGSSRNPSPENVLEDLGCGKVVVFPI